MGHKRTTAARTYQTSRVQLSTHLQKGQDSARLGISLSNKSKAFLMMFSAFFIPRLCFLTSALYNPAPLRHEDDIFWSFGIFLWLFCILKARNSNQRGIADMLCLADCKT